VKADNSYRHRIFYVKLETLKSGDIQYYVCNLSTAAFLKEEKNGSMICPTVHNAAYTCTKCIYNPSIVAFLKEYKNSSMVFPTVYDTLTFITG
jgi:hypothetical protein